jgi:hypothetical protein
MEKFCFKANSMTLLNVWIVIFIIWAVVCLILYYLDKKDNPELTFWRANFPFKNRIDFFWRIFLNLACLWTLFRLMCTLIWGFQ